MADVLAQIEQVRQQAQQELAAVQTPDQLEQFRIKYLGSNGQIKGLMKLLGSVPKDQKPTVGQRANAVREEVTQAFEQKQSQTALASDQKPLIDITEPGRKPQVGNLHILMKVQDELTELFGRMGFAVASGPEVEDEFHNFIALNIPASHPARDPMDNFYLTMDESGNGSVLGSSALNMGEGSGMLLRTQTSTVQIRVMEKQTPPIRVVIPGRVYRPDTVDDTHLFMFHQLEALVVDRGVTMVDLKSTIMQFVHAYFGPETRARFRPSFFPFTEPSAECDVWFPDKNRWIELGGCGMVHPSVFEHVGIDPENFTGWAFGFGIERIAMRKYGINNIRLFIENDVRFLRQF